MSTPEIIKKISATSKALIIVHEFSHRLMLHDELLELLNALEPDKTTQKNIINEVETQLKSSHFPEGRMKELLDALNNTASKEEELTVTRRVRTPHLMPFEQFEFNSAKPKSTTLPATKEMSVAEITQKAKEMSAAKEKKERPSILVADDDARARLIYRVKLEECGYTVVEAQDGTEAWDFIRGGAVNAAVMDMKMPGLHGLEIIGRMVDANLLLPIVVVSAFDQLANEFVIATYPKLKYITKPAPPDEVAEAMLKFIAVVP